MDMPKVGTVESSGNRKLEKMDASWRRKQPFREKQRRIENAIMRDKDAHREAVRRKTEKTHAKAIARRELLNNAVK